MSARTLWRVLGGATAALLVAGTASGFALDLTTHVTTQEMALDPALTRLTVRAGTGDIDVRTARPGETPHATTRLTSSLREAVVARGGTARSPVLTTSCDGPLSGCEAHWEIVVPPGTSLLAHSGVGGITVVGDLRSVTAESGTGDIAVRGSVSDGADLESGIGDLTVDSATAPQHLRAESGTGNVTVTLPEVDGGYRLTGETGSGERHVGVRVDPGGSHRLDLSTGVGDLTLRPR